MAVVLLRKSRRSTSLRRSRSDSPIWDTLDDLIAFEPKAPGVGGVGAARSAELQRKLDVDILPAIGDLPIASIRRADVKAFVKDKAAASPVAANRMLALVRAVFNFAIDEELIEANPAARIKPTPEAPRERALSPAEIKSFWHGLDNTGMAEQLQQALRVMLATGQRRSEVLGATWGEFDTESGCWEIPSSRTKAGRTHRVPLSPLALEVLGEPGEADAPVFANGGGEAFSPYSASQAMRRDLKPLGLADNPATPHDLRRTMASQLGELGISRFIIGKLLNHAEAGVTGRVYDKHDYAEQKRLAMLAWDDRLREIVTGKEAPSNVAKLERAEQ
jgi:integrase